ncbi:hypothetical protein [Massilia genomosp. 1]|uniref:hypothetical protein n=1 Tax=Massilia genomosp. 1 TaxID=2609280 RepID=UPI001C9E8C77|nr:hypothetical protein [Massilia genomosp. 1]
MRHLRCLIAPVAIALRQIERLRIQPRQVTAGDRHLRLARLQIAFGPLAKIPGRMDEDCCAIHLAPVHAAM